MFNLGAGEIAVILIVALLLLGPDKLPELARGIGKFVREFRRQTDDVRGSGGARVLQDGPEVFAEDQGQAKRIEPPAPAEEAPPATPSAEGGELPPPTYPSVFPSAGGRRRREGTLGRPAGHGALGPRRGARPGTPVRARGRASGGRARQAWLRKSRPSHG
jgi:sec-independent protein translocase protein TatB